jgi:hypothetical protein
MAECCPEQKICSDPYLGRMTQADTIIPGGVQGLDRYAAMNNNPVKYTDPSGHRACNGTEDETAECNTYQETQEDDIKAYESAIQTRSKWNINEKWSLSALKMIFVAGWNIENYVDGFTGNKGLAWMNKFMGGATFVHGDMLGNNYVTGDTVHLADGVTSRWIVHELAHVYDNRSAANVGVPFEALWFGGGNSDAMFYNLNGFVPFGIRWTNGTSFNQYPFDPRDGYGNHSTDDYFAEVFALTISPDSKYEVPTDAFRVLESIIRAEVSSLP